MTIPPDHPNHRFDGDQESPKSPEAHERLNQGSLGENDSVSQSEHRRHHGSDVSSRREAPILRRWIAMMLDGFIEWVALAFVNFLFFFFVSGVFELVTSIVMSPAKFFDGGGLSMLGRSFTVSALFVGIVNRVLIQWYYGGSLGKLAVGLRVVALNENDSNDFIETETTLKDLVLRYFASYLSSFVFGFGYIMAIWTKRHRALHDYIAKTLVVTE